MPTLPPPSPTLVTLPLPPAAVLPVAAQAGSNSLFHAASSAAAVGRAAGSRRRHASTEARSTRSSGHARGRSASVSHGSAARPVSWLRIAARPCSRGNARQPSSSSYLQTRQALCRALTYRRFVSACVHAGDLCVWLLESASDQSIGSALQREGAAAVEQLVDALKPQP